MNPSSQPENHLDNDKEELKLKSQLINALQVFDLLPYEQDSKYGSGKENKEDYWRKCEKAIDQYTQSKLKAFAGEYEKKQQDRIKKNKSFCGCPMCEHHSEPYKEKAGIE